jgi:uncharacterized protein YkwD
MRRLIVGTLIALLLLAYTGNSGCANVEAASEDEVLERINLAREDAGLDALVVDESLQSAAQIRASECATSFSHTRPSGAAWYTVGSTRGENLAHARNNNQKKAENVVLAWMLSPKHKENVLRSTFSSVGIAYYEDDTGDTYIVCEFN